MICYVFVASSKQGNSNFLLSKVSGSKGDLLQTAFCIPAVRDKSAFVAIPLE